MSSRVILVLMLSLLSQSVFAQTNLYPPPTFAILDKHPDPEFNCLNTVFDVFIEVFGMYVFSTMSAPQGYALHTANVLAEYIDNDSDGVPDDPLVLDYLVKNNYHVPVWTGEMSETFWDGARGTKCEDNISFGASMYYDDDEWALGGISQAGTWDTNLEEVWHVVTRGWSGAYPEAFGNDEDVNKTSLMREAMDVARGGKFLTIPTQYPEGAWYKYYDTTCEYQCQFAEYIYWALMANIGALDPSITRKCEDSSSEWAICTKSELAEVDDRAYNLLNNSEFRLPTDIPQGQYKVAHQLNFAQFADGLGTIESQILLLNLSGEKTTTAQITLRDDNGSLLTADLNGETVIGVKQFQIEASGLKVLTTDGVGDLVVGSVSVTSGQPLAGVVVFSGSGVGAAGVGSSEVFAKGFIAPMEANTDASVRTGVAMMNLETEVLPLTAELLGTDGVLLDTVNLTLPALGHKAVFLDELGWSSSIDLSVFEGILRVGSNGNVSATVIQTRPGQFVTLPVSAIPSN